MLKPYLQRKPAEELLRGERTWADNRQLDVIDSFEPVDRYDDFKRREQQEDFFLGVGGDTIDNGDAMASLSLQASTAPGES